MATLTLSDFNLLYSRATDGTPLGRGWGAYTISCYQCGISHRVAAIVGSVGWLCPSCGFRDTVTVWLGKDGEMASDGGWLEPVGWRHASRCLN